MKDDDRELRGGEVAMYEERVMCSMITRRSRTTMTCRSVDDAPSRQSSSIHPSSEAYLSEVKAGYPVSLSLPLSPVWALDSMNTSSQEENAYLGIIV